MLDFDKFEQSVLVGFDLWRIGCYIKLNGVKFDRSSFFLVKNIWVVLN